MDELAARCQQQLATFRIKELKDVLVRVGAAKQGKKQVLIDKIMAVVMSPGRQQHSQKGFRPGSLFNKDSVSREEVAKVIDDIYRKLNGSGAADLASKGQNLIAVSNSLGRSDEQDEVANWAEGKTRCPCGSSIDSGTMIQCDDAKCGVWQHLNCVIFPEKEGIQPEIPSQFYCEICRIQSGDPFCVSLAHPLLPTKLTTSILGSDRSSPLQNVEKPFVLSRADLELLHRPNHDIQVWCVLLNDKVQLRMQWPAYPDLHVNGVPVRATNRPGQQLLGANGRDDGPGIVTCIREGTNRLSFSAYDSRPFCLGVRIIRRLTLQQVVRLVPSQSEGESFDAALARVRRCIGGGGGLGNDDDSDSDLEVVAESVTVNLRCPMSGSRIKVAGRFSPCIHMGCFDLHTFVELSQRTRKWQCPICLKNYSLENLIIDPFFNQIATSMRSYGEDVTEIEMKPDGFWRPKLEGDARLHETWRSPDGLTSLAKGGFGSLSEQGNLKPVKIEEDVSMERMPLKIGIKRTQDGIWKVNGIRAPLGLAGHSFPGRNSLQRNTLFSRSSSATASNNEDPSVNQESSDYHHHSTKNEAEANSKLMEPASAWQTAGSLVGEPQSLKNSEVIVLSDTEEEIADDFNIGSSAASGYDGSENVRPTIFAMLPSPEELIEEAQVDHNGIAFAPWNGDHVQSTTERSHTFTEVESVPNTADQPLDFFAGNGSGLNLPVDNSNFWASQQDPPFEFFSFASDAPDADRSHHCGPVRPIAVPAVPRRGYGFSSHHQREQGMLGTSFLDHNRLGNASTFLASDCNGESMGSTRGLSSVDPSLRLFLPPQPARASVQSTVREPLVASSEGIRDDWFSLSLGGGESILDTSTSTVMAAARQIDRHTQERGRLDSLANTASALLGMCSNGAGDNPTHVQKSRPDVTGHRLAQRPRHCFRVDSDSE